MTASPNVDAQLHRPRCCGDPKPKALWGIGDGSNDFITVTCENCWTDLVTLDPPSGGDRGVYLGPWVASRASGLVDRAASWD